MRIEAAALIAGITLGVATPATSSSFDIYTSYDFTGSGLDVSGRNTVRSLVDRAANFWTRHITGYTEPDPVLQGVYVPVRFETRGFGVLASVTDVGIWPGASTSNGITYSAFQPFTINTDALPFLSRNLDLAFDVALHELAHAIGFGLRWEENGVYVNGSGEYTGSEGLAAYQEEFDPSATFVPVEVSTGLPGSDNSHWAEDWSGGSSTVLTAFADPDSVVTDTTLLSFRDIGYTTLDRVAPVPLPAIGPLMAAFLTVWLVLGRARRRSV